MEIVDTHQHLWDLSKFRLPWIDDEPRLANSFLMSDYLAATAGLGITKTIYMEVDMAEEQHLAEVDYVGQLCQADDNPMDAAVVSGRPGQSGFREYLAELKKRPFVKGVRRVLHVPETPPGHCLEENFIADIRAIGDAGLRFDICIRRKELPDAEKLIAACPNTRFILDHCGNADVRASRVDQAQWKRDIEAIVRHDNVMCKVSGFILTVGDRPWSADDLAPIVNHVFDAFGPDRVMFGGDWPVCTLSVTLAQWIEALKQVVKERSDADQRKLFHDNAAQFYGLS